MKAKPNDRTLNSSTGDCVISYRHLLALLGSVLIILGAVERGWALLATWLGCNFLALAIAHSRGAHWIFGKRPDGRLPIWSWILFLPLLSYTYAIWHLLRVVSRESARSIVTDQLVVGRRLLPSEFDERFENYVDLTAEFSEPQVVRCSKAYLSFPILDGAAPSPEALRAALANLRPGRTFVHCAQGHGRTGLFALAMLLTKGVARNVEEGLQMLQASRPGIRLNRDQHRCIQMCLEQPNRG